MQTSAEMQKKAENGKKRIKYIYANKIACTKYIHAKKKAEYLKNFQNISKKDAKKARGCMFHLFLKLLLEFYQDFYQEFYIEKLIKKNRGAPIQKS